MLSRIAIIGSGPAAVAAAWQLSSRGIKPTILDVGDGLPDKQGRLVQELRATFPDWNPATVDAITENPTVLQGAIPKKLVFGSDYFHGNDRTHSPIMNESFISPTFARGGYTVAWGGAMLPVTGEDMSGWPLTEVDLIDGFANILRRVPVSGEDDGLSRRFSLFGRTPEALPIHSQDLALLRRLDRLGRDDNFLIGRARLAVKATECRHCGLCLSGCPFDAIHMFDQTVLEMSKNGQVNYVPNVVVTRLQEEGGTVRVSAINREGADPMVFEFDRVLLAAGAISSTRIVLESLGLYDMNVTMHDSQKFAVPILIGNAQDDDPSYSNTLPSLFLDSRFPRVSPHWTHLQISPMNHYAMARLEKTLRIGPFRMRVLAKTIGRRIMVGWGGLHSDHSGHFSLKLLRAHRYGRPVLKLEAYSSRETGKHVRSVLWSLFRKSLPQGVYFLPPAAVIPPTGAGFHFGGTMPMSSQPRDPLDTDKFGKLQTWKHINVIDSSILPTIPGTTMVLTIMANAWRIASSL